MQHNRCFSVEHISEGCISGYLRDDENEIFFDNSNTENFTEDLLLAVLSAVGEIAADEHRSIFWADLEPMQARWTVFGSNSRIRITVTNFDSSRNVAQAAVTVTLDKDVLLRDMAAALGEVLERFGIYGYRYQWKHEFPLSLYLHIKDLAENGDSTALSKVISESENMGIAAEGSFLSKEKAAF